MCAWTASGVSQLVYTQFRFSCAQVLTGHEPELLDEFRDQVVDELVACKSIYADDFMCFPVLAVGAPLPASADGVDELENAIEAHRDDAFLAVLKLRAEESVVPGQGFLQVLIDNQRQPRAAGRDGGNYSVAFLCVCTQFQMAVVACW